MAGVYVSYFQLRKQLHDCVPELNLSVVSKEQVIFSRLLYRAKSQHRREKCFQKLVRASKDIKKYVLFAPDEQVQNAVKLLSRKPASSDDQHVSKLAWDLLKCASFTAATLKHLEDTFGEVLQQLVRRLFVPVNILFVASLSRFWYCLRYHFHHIVMICDILRPYLLGNTGEQLPQVHVYLPHCYHCYLSSTQGLTPLPSLAMDVPSLGVSIPPVFRSVMDLSQSTPFALSSAVDFGVPVKPSVEQLISRQKDFSSAVVPKAILFRDDVTIATRDKRVTRDRAEKLEGKCHTSVLTSDSQVVRPDRRNRRLVKVLARMRRLCGGAAILRRTPFGGRVNGLSRSKYVRHLNHAYKNKRKGCKTSELHTRACI